MSGGGNEPRAQQEPSRQHPVDQHRVFDFPLSKAGVTEQIGRRRIRLSMEEGGWEETMAD